MSSFGVARLAARRKLEENRKLYTESLVADKDARYKAAFESNTQKKIVERVKTEMLNNYQKQTEEELLNRRQQLADLYNYERESWNSQILENVDTVETRKAKMMERAYKLKAEREKKRLEYVQQCYDEAWRDSSDEARTLDSNALNAYVTEQRLAQIQEKEVLKRVEEEAERAKLEEYNQYMAALAAAEAEKERTRRLADSEVREGLDQQIADINTRKEEDTTRLAQEAQEELEDIQRGLLQEEADKKQAKLDSIELTRDILEHNAKFKEIREQEEENERAQDAKLLAATLSREKLEKEKEDAKRAADKRQAQLYQQYLKENMVKEREDQNDQENRFLEEQEKIWARREAVLQARESARANLMSAVNEDNKQQIALKQQTQQMQREADLVLSKKLLDEAADDVVSQKEEIIRRRQVAEERNAFLAQQIEARRQELEKEKQEQYLAMKRAEHVQKLLQKKLDEQAGIVKMNFGSKKVAWFE